MTRALRLASGPWACIAITLMAVLTYWSQNILRLGFESVWPTMLAVVGIAILVVALFRLLTGRWDSAGIAAAITAAYIFYAPVLCDAISIAHGAGVVVLLLCAVLLVILFRRLAADHASLERGARLANGVSLIMLAVTTIPLVVNVVGLERNRSKASTALGELDGHASAESPDVWQILFDRYAANSTLKSVYDFDNGAFLDALRQRGFTVSENSFSNYQRTGPSVASTMNGALLDPMSKPMAGQAGDWVPIYRSMRDGAAIRQFDRMGYQTVFAGSWWEPTRFSNSADNSIQIRALPQLARLLLDKSAIGYALGSLPLPYLDGRNDQCFRVKEKIRSLEAVARSKQRKMVFAHFLVPHPPFVMNADGSCRAVDDARTASRRDNYVGQIQFANTEALELIDAIMAGPRPAVIVFHSDEGPWPEPYVGDEHGLGTDPVVVPWERLNNAQMHEKYAIQLAVREPDGKPPETMPTSPVQIYPAILKDHFASKRPLPPSRHYLYRNESALYDFVDIGDRL